MLKILLLILPLLMACESRNIPSLTESHQTELIQNELEEVYAYHLLSLYYSQQKHVQKSIIAKNFAHRKINTIRPKMFNLKSQDVEKIFLALSLRSHFHQKITQELIDELELNFHGPQSQHLSSKSNFQEVLKELKKNHHKYQIYVANIEHTALITKN